jgi:long-chain acyl-CoA synthetase
MHPLTVPDTVTRKRFPMKRKNKTHPKIASIRELMTHILQTDPDYLAYRYPQGNTAVDVPFRAFYDSVEAIGAALTDLGVADKHIACVADNSYPWIQTFLTALMSAGVYVPIDRDLPVEQLIFILNDSDSEVVFCDAKHKELLLSHLDELEKIKFFICFDDANDTDGRILSFPALIERGMQLPKDAYDAQRSDPDALKMLVYTSGTTGIAKGVMLTERNLCSCQYYGFQICYATPCGLSVLPYHHTYAMSCDILAALYDQTTLCINDNLKNVVNNLKLFAPSHIILVPAFAEYFYDSIMRTIKRRGKLKAFNKLIKLSQGLRKVGIDLRRTFFKSIHKQFGGNLRLFVCGGAPIRPEIGQFFDQIGITMIGGYGITECSPLVSANSMDANDFTTAGRRLPCLEWRIDEPDENGIGEICVKGETVMLGYYKRPDLTEEVIRDGWFYTGDYGYITPKDEVVITGRKKNIVVLNNGKNIYPEEIENQIMSLDYITETVVRGMKNDHGEEYALSAEVYMADQPREESTVLSDIRRILRNLPPYKQIARVIVRKEPFAKTSTRKIKRNG